jgi:hypothetical protein
MLIIIGMEFGSLVYMDAISGHARAFVFMIRQHQLVKFFFVVCLRDNVCGVVAHVYLLLDEHCGNLPADEEGEGYLGKVEKLVLDKVQRHAVALQVVNPEMETAVTDEQHNDKPDRYIHEDYAGKHNEHGPSDDMGSKGRNPVILVHWVRGVCFPPRLLLQIGETSLEVKVVKDVKEQHHKENVN